MSRLSAALLLCLALLCAAAAPAAAAKPVCTGRPGIGGWKRLKQQEIGSNAALQMNAQAAALTAGASSITDFAGRGCAVKKLVITHACTSGAKTQWQGKALYACSGAEAEGEGYNRPIKGVFVASP